MEVTEEEALSSSEKDAGQRNLNTLPVLQAMQKGIPKEAVGLLQMGEPCDFDLKDDDGDPILSTAAQKGYTEVLQKLLQRAALGGFQKPRGGSSPAAGVQYRSQPSGSFC